MRPNDPTPRKNGSNAHASLRYRKAAAGSLAALSAALLFIAGCSSSSSSSAASSGGAGTQSPAGQGTHLNLAYLSFAVQNSYDAPMLAAAKAAAANDNATLTVFDANNSAQTQFSQLQDAIASGKYQGIAIQAVDGSTLAPLIAQATAKHIKVVALDQVLGPKLTTSAIQVPGLSASVVFIQHDEGYKSGTLTLKACAALKANPCNVGYLYDVKASSIGQSSHAGFEQAIAANPDVKAVAEGQAQYTAAGGLTATQTMLQANPGLNVIVGSDQGIQGAIKAVAAAGKQGKILLIGTGGSAAGYAAVKVGQEYGDVATLPASEGRLALAALVKALRAGTSSGSIDPVAGLPGNGMVTKVNVPDFNAEWPG